MSGQFALVPAEIFQSSISSAAKLVFCCLRLHADKGGSAFPSLARLQKEASLSRWSILKGLLELESTGLISRIRRRTASGDPDSTLYRLSGGCSVDELPSLPDEQRCSVDAQGVVCQTNKGCLSDKLYQYHLSRPTEQKSGKSPEAPSSRKEPSEHPLKMKTEAVSQSQEPLDGRQSPEEFERTCRKFFEEFIRAYPKPGSGSKKAYETFKAFFSPEEQYFERNATRFQNVMGATIAYGRSVNPGEPRFIRSAERFLLELDADLPVEEEVTLLVRKTA